MKLNIVNPITYPGWDDMLLAHNDSNIFHSSCWAKVLHESYGYTPLYFSLIDNGQMRALIPIMEINSPLTGKRGVSLPFTDYCYPILPDDMQFQDVFNVLTDHGKKTGWKYLELRGIDGFSEDIDHSAHYYGHVLELSQDENEVFAGFKDSNRRNIRKAIKEGVEVKVATSAESIKEFYRLNCMTRQMHGLPPQPYSFFQKIYEHVISINHGMVVLAKYNNQVIAGAVYFQFGKKAVYKYGASDGKYQNVRANNLVMWKAIQWYCQKGHKSFCFGRTDTDHDGLMQFKNGWGAEKKILKYYRFDIAAKEYVRSKSRVSGFHNKVFEKMPIPLLKAAGSVLYRHVG